MLPIAEIIESAAGMSTADLENQKQLRDVEIARLRAEQGKLHDLLEPRWMAAQVAGAGPANLRQVIVKGIQ